MTRKPLLDRYFIITRPAPQAKQLSEKIENLGGKSHCFPTIEISPLINHPSLSHAIKKLNTYDYAIFLSANAAKFALPMWPHGHSYPKIIAIGPGTANCIKQLHFAVDFIPLEFSSEGIVNLPILKNTHGKKIIIFCGKNSRPYLKNTLLHRHTVVEEAICYQRKIPSKSLSLVDFSNANCIITSSNEGLKNFFYLIEKSNPSSEHTAHINHIPFLVISEKMLTTLKELQPNQPSIIANNASDDAIIDALITYFEKK